MTTVPSVTNPAATGQSSAAKQLSGNFNTFLTLLTTQLKNQDPLSPMDSNQFTQQLVQFSSVEQQISTNDNLKQLISQSKSQSNIFAMSYLGRSVVMTNGTASLADGKATWTYGLDGGSVNTQLTVTDASGKTVFAKPGENTAGTHTFEWDGTDFGGNALPPGPYKLAITAKAADGTAVKSSIASRGVVSAIDMSSGTPELVVGSMVVPLSDATLIGVN